MLQKYCIFYSFIYLFFYHNTFLQVNLYQSSILKTDQKYHHLRWYINLKCGHVRGFFSKYCVLEILYFQLEIQWLLQQHIHHICPHLTSMPSLPSLFSASSSDRPTQPYSRGVNTVVGTWYIHRDTFDVWQNIWQPLINHDLIFPQSLFKQKVQNIFLFQFLNCEDFAPFVV